MEGTGRNSYSLQRLEDGTFVSKPGLGGARNVVFEHNILYGNFEDLPEGWSSHVGDPRLKAPGTGGDGLDSLQGYQILEDSPAVSAGLPVEENGGRDFWGNPVAAGENPAIGVHER